jgi:hypothetical protein
MVTVHIWPLIILYFPLNVVSRRALCAPGSAASMIAGQKRRYPPPRTGSRSTLRREHSSRPARHSPSPAAASPDATPLPSLLPRSSRRIPANASTSTSPSGSASPTPASKPNADKIRKLGRSARDGNRHRGRPASPAQPGHGHWPVLVVAGRSLGKSLVGKTSVGVRGVAWPGADPCHRRPDRGVEDPDPPSRD